MPQSQVPSSAVPTPSVRKPKAETARKERLIAYRPVALQLPAMVLPFATASRSRWRQCCELYGLSAREAEVAEHHRPRQHCGPHRGALFVSENTVRTHSKRIYVKLDIHKRQELIDLVESFEPEGR